MRERERERTDPWPPKTPSASIAVLLLAHEAPALKNTRAIPPPAKEGENLDYTYNVGP